MSGDRQVGSRVICYSDGWCEQGARWGGTTSSEWQSSSVTLVKAYKDNNYSLILQGNFSSSGAGSSSCAITAKSKTGFTTTYAYNQTAQTPYYYACGFVTLT